MPDASRAIYSPRWAWMITFPLALIGLADSAYLTYAHYHPKLVLSCPDTGHINCLKVTTSSQSMIFGHIPVALTGLIYYVALTVVVSPWLWRMTDPRVVWLRLAAVISGVGMVCYLVYVEAVQLKAICLYCTGVHIITFLIFMVVLAAYLLRPLEPIET